MSTLLAGLLNCCPFMEVLEAPLNLILRAGGLVGEFHRDAQIGWWRDYPLLVGDIAQDDVCVRRQDDLSRRRNGHLVAAPRLAVRGRVVAGDVLHPHLAAILEPEIQVRGGGVCGLESRSKCSRVVNLAVCADSES